MSINETRTVRLRCAGVTRLLRVRGGHYMNAPLAGITIVEAANYVSGPWAGMMLADLGAQVIKIEPPKGDPYRRFAGASLSAHWMSVNRGKRSVVADLKTPDGVSRLLDLVDDADVFLSNWRPDVSERLGVGDAAIAARNRRLIRVWITGWGPSGPSADEPAFDAVMQARTSMIDGASREGRLELLAGYPIDKATAMLAVQSVTAALFARERGSGDGERIDLAMIDVASYVNFPDLMTSRVFVDDAPEDAHSTTATAIRSLPSSDGAVVITAVSGAQIKGACRAVGHPEWASDLFATTGRMMDIMYQLFAPVTSKAPMDLWLTRFSEEDVPASACLTIDEHLADPQVVHNEIYSVAEVPEFGRVRSVRYPAVGQSWGRLASGPPPTLLEGGA
jgi:crotonobetainyl-CoA:carnitine CoA-transferase CaiB-like acyl-CoA transferase